MAMFGQKFNLIIFIKIKYFIIVRFPILRPGDGGDELQHIVLLQGMSCERHHQHDVLTWYLLDLQVDQSWANSTVLDVLTSVPDYEECRALCRVMIINKDDICNPP